MARIDKDLVEGESVVGEVRSFKSVPPKFNSKGELTQDALLVASIALPNTRAMARKLSDLTRDPGSVEITLEKVQMDLPWKIADAGTGASPPELGNSVS